MKAFISVDLEGMPYIVSVGHLGPRGSLFEEARKVATKVTLIVATQLNKEGFDEVTVADSHGPMINLVVDDLPEYVEIIRGPLRPTSMISGAEGCDAALFLGYHAKFGTEKSVFDHTYSGGTINSLKVNGVAVSEYLLNAYTAGDLGVPSIMVGGDFQLLKDDVEKFTPWAEGVALKYSISRVAARSLSMLKIEKQLKTAVTKAVGKLKRHEVKPLTAKKPVKIEISFIASHFADVAELSPNVKRVSGLNVQYTATDMIQAYKTFQLLVLAAAGTSLMLTERKG